MNRFLIILILIPSLVLAQSSVETKYFSDKYASKEVGEGPYRLTIEKINDSVTNHVFAKTKNDQKIWSRSYLNDRPYGIWQRFDKKGNLESSMDYNFVLKYGEHIPEGAVKYTELEIDKFSDHNTKELQNHIRKHFRYPEIAQENNTQGRITMQFTIDKDGKVGNISILEGVSISLDTECFRIINSLKTLEPYSINGEKIMVYYTIPITFRLA